MVMDQGLREGRTWTKSSFSAPQGNCVEARLHDGRIQVRDSKAPFDAMLSFTPEEWRAFTEGVEAGEFDLL
jgi:hypothetical protein